MNFWILFLSFCLLSTSAWSQFTKVTIASNFNAPIDIAAGDINTDGLDDVVVLSKDMVVWYENLGDGKNWSGQKLISSVISNATSLVVFDVDEDGDMDVVVASGSTTSNSEVVLV